MEKVNGTESQQRRDDPREPDVANRVTRVIHSIESQLEDLRARLKAYEAPVSPPELPKGIIKLGKKTPDGVVRLQAS